MTVNYAAFDLGTTFGYAIFNETHLIHHGFEKLKPKPGKYNRFESIVCNLINRYDIKALYYEKVRRHMGVDAAHVYGGYEAILQKIAFSFNIECVGIGVTQIKKACTGYGKAKKEHVIACVNDHYKLSVKDHNEADSLAIAYYAQYKGFL